MEEKKPQINGHELQINKEYGVFTFSVGYCTEWDEIADLLNIPYRQFLDKLIELGGSYDVDYDEIFFNDQIVMEKAKEWIESLIIMAHLNNEDEQDYECDEQLIDFTIF